MDSDQNIQIRSTLISTKGKRMQEDMQLNESHALRGHGPCLWSSTKEATGVHSASPVRQWIKKPGYLVDCGVPVIGGLVRAPCTHVAEDYHPGRTWHGP